MDDKRKQPEKDTQVVYIWDDPESRVQFLETVLRNQEWKAVVCHPEFDPHRPSAHHPLADLQQSFTKRGYKSALGHDDKGMPILTLQNFDNDTSLTHAMKEMGVVKGVAYKFRSLGQPLTEALHKTKEVTNYLVGDKARLIGTIYLFGDLFLSLTGFSNKADDGLRQDARRPGFLERIKEPSNLLQSISGVMATAQSLIFMGFAKEGQDVTYSELKNADKTAAKQEKDFFDLQVWKEIDEAKPKGVAGHVHKLMTNHAIQIGALSQAIGQLCLIVSGGLRLHSKTGLLPGSNNYTSQTLFDEKVSEARRGGGADIATGIASIIGWSLLVQHPKKIDQKKSWSNPGGRLVQEVQESPNKYASTFHTLATVMGLYAGKEKSNTAQLLGNAVYLAGDGLMFFTKSESYKSDPANVDMLIAGAKKFIEDTPIVMGKTEMGEFVQQLADHLAERGLTEKAKQEKGEVSTEEVKKLSHRLAVGLEAELPAVHVRANETAQKLAAVVEEFPLHAREKIANQLCQVLCDVPGMAIGQQELKSHVMRQVNSPEMDKAPEVSLDRVADPMANLLFSVPGTLNAKTVNRLYDALAEHLTPDQEAIQKIEDFVNSKAAADVSRAAGKSRSVEPRLLPPATSRAESVLASRRELQPSGAGRIGV